MNDDSVNPATMQEAADVRLPRELRSFFSSLICFADVQDPVAFWERFKNDLMQDFLARGLSIQVSESKAYWEIVEDLTVLGVRDSPLFQLNLPKYDIDIVVVDPAEHARLGSDKYLQLNPEQLRATDEVLAEVADPSGQCFFIDGPGGSGKTFVYQTIYHILSGMGKKILSVAWTGIAANLLEEGRTVSTAFRLLIKTNNKESSMKRQSIEARALAEIDLIIWDEAPMAPKEALEAADALLKDIMQNDVPFGGKVMVLGGDFRQVLPVVDGGGRAEMVSACLKSSRLWPLFRKFELTTNMRVRDAGNDWKDYLLALGNDLLDKDEEGYLEVPEDLRCEQDLAEAVFRPAFDEGVELSEVAILTPKNEQALELNNRILDMLPGEVKTFRSADSAETTDPTDAANFNAELLNKMTPSGMPPHLLHLKVGCIVMLLRNLSVKKGLCNGTRLIVEQIGARILLCTIATGSRKGKKVLIPRIDCLYDKATLPFVLKRRQFPVRLSFAMTINKSQGQSFEKVGIAMLHEEIFAHGQLYVALSRARSRKGVSIMAKDNKMKNVVYEEVLE